MFVCCMYVGGRERFWGFGECRGGMEWDKMEDGRSEVGGAGVRMRCVSACILGCRSENEVRGEVKVGC